MSRTATIMPFGRLIALVRIRYSQITITKMGSWPGVIVRADGVLDRFYLGLLVGAERLFGFMRRWDGGYYLLATGTTETWQVGDVLTLGVIGSAHPVTVTLYHNGNAVLSWTSSSQAEVKNGGSPGIGIFSPSGEALTLDNWEGGNLGPDTQPPSAPGNLVATAIGVSQVHLSWTASTDDVGVTGYLVERQDPGSPNFVQVGTTSTGTSYNDTGLVAGSAYSYRVRATDAAQNLSDYSAVASATTLAGIAASDDFNRADGALGVNWAKPVPASQNRPGHRQQPGRRPMSRTRTIMPIGRLIASAKISIPRCGSAIWGRGTG